MWSGLNSQNQRSLDYIRRCCVGDEEFWGFYGRGRFKSSGSRSHFFKISVVLFQDRGQNFIPITDAFWSCNFYGLGDFFMISTTFLDQGETFLILGRFFCINMTFQRSRFWVSSGHFLTKIITKAPTLLHQLPFLFFRSGAFFTFDHFSKSSWQQRSKSTLTFYQDKKPL